MEIVRLTLFTALAVGVSLLYGIPFGGRPFGAYIAAALACFVIISTSVLFRRSSLVRKVAVSAVLALGMVVSIYFYSLSSEDLISVSPEQEVHSVSARRALQFILFWAGISLAVMACPSLTSSKRRHH